MGNPRNAVVIKNRSFPPFTPLMDIRNPVVCLSFAALLLGCEGMDFLDASKAEERRQADGGAIGAACRLSNRSLEECFQLNPRATKSAVLAGWREMNDYMREASLPSMPPPDPLAAAPHNTLPLSQLPDFLRDQQNKKHPDETRPQKGAQSF